MCLVKRNTLYVFYQLSEDVTLTHVLVGVTLVILLTSLRVWYKEWGHSFRVLGEEECLLS